jgi:hypothetical protein
VDERSTRAAYTYKTTNTNSKKAGRGSPTGTIATLIDAETNPIEGDDAKAIKSVGGPINGDGESTQKAYHNKTANANTKLTSRSTPSNPVAALN